MKRLGHSPLKKHDASNHEAAAMSEHFNNLASTPPKHISSSQRLNVLPGDLMVFQVIKLPTTAPNNYQVATLPLKQKPGKELELEQFVCVYKTQCLLGNLR